MTILTKEQWEASIAETWSTSINATYQDLIDEAVKAERNNTLEEVAKEFEKMKAFEKDTMASFAAFVRGMKK